MLCGVASLFFLGHRHWGVGGEDGFTSSSACGGVWVWLITAVGAGNESSSRVSLL